MQFDHRGTIVSKSQSYTELRTVRKVIHVDSGDRDTLMYFTNGEFVVYLPRTYENVISLRLMSAEFPTIDNAITHSYSLGGQNIPSAVFTSASDTKIATPFPPYFMLEIDGLNKSDETAVGGNKSQYPDAFFAKIVTSAVANTSASGNAIIEYNDHSGQENTAKFSPPIGKLDRMRIRTRLHTQQGSQGFLYWTTSQAYPSTGAIANSLNYCMTFEIEYMDNGFNNYSTMETHIRHKD